MNKGIEKIITAFKNNTPKKVSSSEVTVTDDYTTILYYGSAIAVKDRWTGKVVISNCGYETASTKERLNDVIMEVTGCYSDKIYQKKKVWYWKGDEPFPLDQYVTL